VVPTPETPADRQEQQQESAYVVSPHHIRELEGNYSEEDLITYPNLAPVRQKPTPPQQEQEAEKSLLGELREILKYPFVNTQAMQIFFSGAFFFSPIVWKIALLPMYFPLTRFCCVGYILVGFLLFVVISIRLMYFSYLLLIIEKSAEGGREIPELPLFQSWQENLQDLLKVLGVSAIAFSPFLVYALSVNIEVFMRMLEAYSRGESPGSDVLSGTSYNLGVLLLLYALIAFYLPMVFMVLVVTKSFAKAVNPVFIIRSIFKIGREYLMAMLIIFIVLRGSLTLFTILKDLFLVNWFSLLSRYVAEPVITFYVFVVSMHIIGRLYYRNGKKLEW
jgi:hypothetical protein